MNVQFNINDLPGHNLRLIGPTDASFKGLVSSVLKVNPNDAPEQLQPFSVFVKNVGNRNVIGFTLKWEIVKTDGKVSTKVQSYSSTGSLMGALFPTDEEMDANPGNILRPNKPRFCSFAAASGGSAGQGMGTGTSAPADNRGQPSNVPGLSDQLAQISSITVSIDAAIFQDGSFVGPDTTGMFSRMQAEIDAKREILDALALTFRQNITPSEAINRIKGIAKDTEGAANGFAATTNPKDYWRNVYANEVLRMDAYAGSEKAVAMALRPLYKPWPKLKKIPNE
jgi:hypothetical protein